MSNVDDENRNCGCSQNTNLASNESTCNYQCDCGCNESEEDVLSSMELPTNKNCPRDCEREAMLMKIRELNFAIIELSLYLDTHPDDKKALCLHNNYAKHLKDLKDKYQKVYGPLCLDYPCNKWRWIEEPWPWERGNY